MITVRFAPSPTGKLHFGSLRTAIFNYLFTKKNQGKLILRIEDTDNSRVKKEYIDVILEFFEYLNINFDQIYFQSSRFDIYKQYLIKLWEENKIYPCFCSQEKLKKEREEALKKGISYKYPGYCRNIPKEEAIKRINNGEPHIFRFKLSENREDIEFNDLVYGRINFSIEELDDFALTRSDGSFLYNFTAVIDDHLMGITHIIRGEDHISNTPKQILLYEAFGWEYPTFVHIPMILNSEKKKLSKRDPKFAIEDDFRKKYIPEAVINFVSLMGWAPKGNKGGDGFFTIEQLIREFDIDGIKRKPVIFDRNKLNYLNKKHIRNLDSNKIFYYIEREFKEHISDIERNKILTLIELLKVRVSYLYDFVEHFGYLRADFIVDERYESILPEDILEDYKNLLKTISEDEFKDDKFLEKLTRNFVNNIGIKLKDLAKDLRLILTRKETTPPIFSLMSLIGKHEIIRRLEYYLK